MAELFSAPIGDKLLTEGASSPTPVSDGTAIAVPLPDIKPDPDQPRKTFDQDVIDTMVAQFLDPDVGQLEPIAVRPNPSGETKYLIVHGETRYHAAIKAELKTLQAIVTVNTGFVQQVLSNETRADLPILDKATSYKRLIDHHGYDQKGVATLLGKTDSHVSEFLSLIDMPVLSRRAHNDGKATSVYVLSRLVALEKKYQNKPRKLELISTFIDQVDQIRRGDFNALRKRLEGRARLRKEPSLIDGKPFKSPAYTQDDVGTILTVKRDGDSEPTRYRLVPIN